MCSGFSSQVLCSRTTHPKTKDLFSPKIISNLCFIVLFDPKYMVCKVWEPLKNSITHTRSYVSSTSLVGPRSKKKLGLQVIIIYQLRGKNLFQKMIPCWISCSSDVNNESWTTNPGFYFTQMSMFSWSKFRIRRFRIGC